MTEAEDLPPPEILVVDDERTVAHIAARYLSRSGYRVVVADSGAGALSALRDGAAGVRLVVADLDLGDMSGLDLEHELAVQYPHVRVLLMADYPFPEGPPLRARVLMKPFASFQLLQAVQGALRDIPA